MAPTRAPPRRRSRPQIAPSGAAMASAERPMWRSSGSSVGHRPPGHWQACYCVFGVVRECPAVCCGSLVVVRRAGGVVARSSRWLVVGWSLAAEVGVVATRRQDRRAWLLRTRSSRRCDHDARSNPRRRPRSRPTPPTDRGTQQRNLEPRRLNLKPFCSTSAVGSCLRACGQDRVAACSGSRASLIGFSQVAPRCVRAHSGVVLLL